MPMNLDINRLKMVFGFILLLTLVTLVAIIALGKVHEDSSYGLLPIVTTLSTLAGGFANWAFGNRTDNEGK